MKLFKTMLLAYILVFLSACTSEDKTNTTKKDEKSISTLVSNEVKTVKIAIIADQGVTEHSKNILKLIKAQKADLLLINGDFSYDNNTTRWEKFNKDILGEDFPILATAGNHDMQKWDEYKKILTKWQQHPKLTCNGEVGVMNDCTYEGIKIVLTSPNVFTGNTNEENEEFIRKSFKDDKSIWRICGWHENMTDMQTGGKTDESGWGVYEECRKEGALITTGHEHAYARTHLLSDIPNKVVDSRETHMSIEKGKTIVALSGLGGISSRHLVNDGEWWAAKENADTGVKAGVLFCSFGLYEDEREATCYFMDEDSNVLDQYSLRSELHL